MDSTQQQTTLFLICLLSALVLIRHLILSLVPHVVFSGYLYIFVIGCVIAYVTSQRFHVALLVGITLVYALMLYRYSQDKIVLDNYTGWQNTSIFIIGIVAAYGFAVMAAPFSNALWMHGILFLMILYLAASVIEWVLHRGIMHCYMFWPGLDKMDASKSWFWKQLQKSCHLHKDHHLSVKNDMSLKEVKDDHELIFDWPTTLGIALLGYPLILLITHLLDIRVVWWVQLIAIIIMAIVFSLIWNSIHATMHGEQVHVPLQEGPPNMDVNMPDDAVYVRNHVLHHQIKGEQKGNYNVVFLGADELFQTNRLNS